MRFYIIRRILMLIPTWFMASIAIFILVKLLPGDIVDVLRAQASAEMPVDREEAMQTYGLDAPIYVQYGRWIGLVPQMNGEFAGFFQGKLGESWWRRMTVERLVSGAWPITFQLGLMGIFIGQTIALPIGVYSALRQNKAIDYVGRSIAILCISVPGFWVATMAIVLPSIWWGYMPPIMITHFIEDPLDNLRMFVVPAIVLGMSLAGFTMRLTRTMVLEVLRQDYVRTAWAKGLKEKVVISRHVLKNAMIPVVTSIGLQIPVLIGGTVIIENIFNLPGMGRLMYNAILQRDAPLIMGLIAVLAFAIMVINLLVDLTYAWLDPRIHYR